MTAKKFGNIPSGARKLIVNHQVYRWMVGRKNVQIWGPLNESGQGPKVVVNLSALTGLPWSALERQPMTIDPQTIVSYIKTK